jgi:hypothetical protein
MKGAFPEALVKLSPRSVEAMVGVPDPNDRHVVALAIQARADTIVTENVRDFPSGVLAGYGLTVLSADQFLVHQYPLDPPTMLEKLDRQAAGIKQQRFEVLRLLRQFAPAFCQLCGGDAAS